MSHNARTHNVVLKLTVPKRTGRKRKRGSNDPWQGDVELPDTDDAPDQRRQVHSHSRLDDPKLLRRKLADTVNQYQVEAVGTSRHTHRFRGLADFYWNTSGRSGFAQRYTEQVLPGNGESPSLQNVNSSTPANVGGSVEDIKQFKFTPGIDKGPNVDVLPPPVFTHMSLPFNYFYSQNPYVRVTEDGQTFNATAVKQVGHFIAAEDPAPEGPQHTPDMMDPRTVEVMADLEAAFDERPVWTRRSLMNYLGGKLKNWSELKKYLNYAAYQFKGGPWRDCVVPYGLDPRTDPKYRIYQTVMFKILPFNPQGPGEQAWRSLHSTSEDGGSGFQADPSESHLFDGSTYHLDGKVWQVCDITDPLLKGMLDNAAVRPTRDAISGFYHGGLWAKVKAIMKTKMIAIRFGRRLSARDFAVTMLTGDETPMRSSNSTSVMPMPNLGLTEEELKILRGSRPGGRRSGKYTGYNVRVRRAGASEEQPADQSFVAAEGDLHDLVQDESDNEFDSASGSDNGSGDEAGDDGPE